MPPRELGAETRELDVANYDWRTRRPLRIASKIRTDDDLQVTHETKISARGQRCSRSLDFLQVNWVNTMNIKGT